MSNTCFNFVIPVPWSAAQGLGRGIRAELRMQRPLCGRLQLLHPLRMWMIDLLNIHMASRSVPGVDTQPTCPLLPDLAKMLLCTACRGTRRSSLAHQSSWSPSLGCAQASFCHLHLRVGGTQEPLLMRKTRTQPWTSD